MRRRMYIMRQMTTRSYFWAAAAYNIYPEAIIFNEMK